MISSNFGEFEGNYQSRDGGCLLATGYNTPDISCPKVDSTKCEGEKWIKETWTNKMTGFFLVNRTDLTDGKLKVSLSRMI